MIESIILDWGTWCEVCDFIPKDQFVVGTYIDDAGEAITGTSNRIGVWLKGKDGKNVLIRQKEHIYKSNNRLMTLNSIDNAYSPL